MRVLACGGAGYIGGHTMLALLEAGHTVVAYDNLSNGSDRMIAEVGVLTGNDIPLVVGDVRDREKLDTILKSGNFDCVIHFAALKSVGQSVEDPLLYYENNVGGMTTLLSSMHHAGVRNLIFSSSATVYALGAQMPVTEEAPLGPVNPYGRSKWIAEMSMQDLTRAWPDLRAVSLRYFNPAGAHPSGRIGEDPKGVPDNLMPFVSRVAAGLLPEVRVFGSDYPTHDGTGVRDYIHVMDLAEGHVAALESLSSLLAGWHVYNLGRGEGFSVLDLVERFSEVNQVDVPYRIVGRRPGDLAAVWADPTKAHLQLGWQATRDLDEICRDAWRWQRHALAAK